MGQPNPPGDLPLIEGLGPEWNEFVSAFPEDQRSTLGPKLKDHVSSITSEYEPLKQWADFQKAGVTPDQASMALNIFEVIEKNPREVYDALANHLGISKAEAKEVVKEIQNDDSGDSRIETLKNQVDTLTQIALAQRNMTAKEQEDADAEAWLDEQLGTIKQKYGDSIDENQIIMRMAHAGMTVEEAYQDWSNMVAQIRKTREAPVLMGSGGNIPTNRAIDPKKLDSKATKDIVRQMLDHANAQNQ